MAHEGWAIVELMGHKRVAGRICETTFCGAQMMQIDVPMADGDAFEAPQLVAPGAIYRVTFTTEERVRREGTWGATRPVAVLPAHRDDDDVGESPPDDGDDIQF